MIDKLLNHVKSYQDIYSFISRGQKTEGEVREFLESTGRAESTVRTFLTSLKKRETPGLLVSKDGIIYVDAVKSRAFIDELMEVLQRGRSKRERMLSESATYKLVTKSGV